MNAYLFYPSLVIQHLKLHEHFGHLVVVSHDAFTVLPLQNLGVIPQVLHRFLDSSEHLSGPHDLAGDGREIPSDGRVMTKSLVGLLDVFYVATELEQDFVILVEDGFL